MEEVFRKVPREEIYRATGIQFMSINTLYQMQHIETRPRLSQRQEICLPSLISSIIG